MIDKKLNSYGLRPNKIASEEVFLRRAYLKVIGRIPTLEETKEFLEDRDRSSKKSALIDKLLGSHGYVSHWFHLWADILRAKENLGNRVSGRPYMDYIRESIATNKPYDEWVKEMEELKIPCGPIFNIKQAVENPQIKERNMIIKSYHKVIGEFKSAGNPIKMSTYKDEETRGDIPDLDEHREKIIKEFG